MVRNFNFNHHFSTTSSLINSSNHSVTTTLANTIPPITNTTPSNPFQSTALQFTQQSPQFPTTISNLSLSTIPYAGFGNDTQRHALQILAAVGALSYAQPNNLLPYIPPLPPAPPPFTLVPNTFPAQIPPTANGRLSPSIKRPLDEHSNSNLHADDNIKRVCYETASTQNTRTHNFDDESIALVPPLIDANINTLKK